MAGITKSCAREGNIAAVEEMPTLRPWQFPPRSLVPHSGDPYLPRRTQAPFLAATARCSVRLVALRDTSGDAGGVPLRCRGMEHASCPQ